MKTSSISRLVLTFGVASCLMAVPGAVHAQSIVSQSASVRTLSPVPASLAPGAVESDTFVELVLEKQYVLLSTSLTVDITATGTANSTNTLSPGSIAAGTRVNSLYLFTDPVTDGQPGIGYDATLTLDRDILGIIIQNFTTSDLALGVSGVDYGDSTLRGLEMGPDTVTISSDRRTVTFHANTVMRTDSIRVITAAVAAPEPGSLALLLPLLGAVSLVRRRKTNR